MGILKGFRYTQLVVIFIVSLVLFYLISFNGTPDTSIEDLQDLKPSTENITDRAESNQVDNDSTFNIALRDNPQKDLLAANTDYVGWIEIDGTPISYPIVKGQDNDYYLEHNFDKEKDKRGAIYMDYRNFSGGLDQHTIIYGHNLKDDTFFGLLSEYMDESFFNEHPIITIDFLYSTKQYRIFSVYYDVADPYYIRTAFDEVNFESYLDKIIGNSIYPSSLDVTEEDNILSLITCSYEVDDGRYYIHAVEIE